MQKCICVCVVFKQKLWYTHFVMAIADLSDMTCIVPFAMIVYMCVYVCVFTIVATAIEQKEAHGNIAYDDDGRKKKCPFKHACNIENYNASTAPATPAPFQFRLPYVL